MEDQPQIVPHPDKYCESMQESEVLTRENPIQNALEIYDRTDIYLWPDPW